jgi:hypothetical protein
VTDRDDQLALVERLRATMTEQADRLDRLVDDNVSLAPGAGPELVDLLTSAALVAQAARDFAARRIDDAEYERRLVHARALLPDRGAGNGAGDADW